MERIVSLKPWAGMRVLVLSPTPTHPQDYGNRKRIHRICTRFSDEGARVTFVHYPAEMEWRRTIPRSAERAMMQAWTQYYTIGPTRELHANPSGKYHAIDGWWDEAIGSFLRWLFSVQSFDVFVVNYAWLSKAFEYAPGSLLKILDVHDKISGRREMLESLGLNPEFFFATEDEERIALSRADLIWAIKNEERALFESMTTRPVLTMPHIEPLRILQPPAPDPDGYFRVGIIGARNNINRVNIGGFLKTAEPIFRDAFAPLKIVVAGSVCDLLTEIDSPYVDLQGRIENVEDFYGSVDCVAIPMRTSTGIKIRTGEAISLGLPVISLAHGFEGYEASDELHSLSDFDAMARALVNLSFDPNTRLTSLASASIRAHDKTSVSVNKAFEQTHALCRRKRPSIVVAVDSRAFVVGNIFHAVFRSLNEYLRDFANITVLVVRGSAAHVLKAEVTDDWPSRIIVDEALTGVDSLRDQLVSIGIEVFGVEGFLRFAQPHVLIADALHSALSRDCCRNTTIILRTEMIAFSAGTTEIRLPVAQCRSAYVATPRLSRDLAAQMMAANAEPLLASCFCGPAAIELPRKTSRKMATTVALLGTPDAPAVALAAAFAQAWELNAQIVCGISANTGLQKGQHGVKAYSHADDYIAAILAGHTERPRFAIDLSAGAVGMQICREFLEQLQVPVIATAATGPAGLRQLCASPLNARSEGELWGVFRAAVLDFEEMAGQVLGSAQRELDSDRGWARIKRQWTQTFELEGQTRH